MASPKSALSPPEIHRQYLQRLASQQPQPRVHSTAPDPPFDEAMAYKPPHTMSKNRHNLSIDTNLTTPPYVRRPFVQTPCLPIARSQSHETYLQPTGVEDTTSVPIGATALNIALPASRTFSIAASNSRYLQFMTTRELTRYRRRFQDVISRAPNLEVGRISKIADIVHKKNAQEIIEKVMPSDLEALGHQIAQDGIHGEEKLGKSLSAMSVAIKKLLASPDDKGHVSELMRGIKIACVAIFLEKWKSTKHSDATHRDNIAGCVGLAFEMNFLDTPAIHLCIVTLLRIDESHMKALSRLITQAGPQLFVVLSECMKDIRSYLGITLGLLSKLMISPEVKDSVEELFLLIDHRGSEQKCLTKGSAYRRTIEVPHDTASYYHYGPSCLF